MDQFPLRYIRLMTLVKKRIVKEDFTGDEIHRTVVNSSLPQLRDQRPKASP